MSISGVRTTLSEFGSATASQLAAETGLDRDSLDAALAFWLNRGDVLVEKHGEDCGPESCGGGCRGCSVERPGKTSTASGSDGGQVQIYRWVHHE